RSPEQASGHAVDFRSDQFALGSILYEMATGRRAFAKKTAVDTLSAILNEEPEPIASVSPQAPAPLRWIVERCLTKDVDGRYASTTDLARELRTVSNHVSEAVLSGGVAAAAASRRRRIRWAAAAVALMALFILAGTLLVRRKAVAPPTFQQVTFQKTDVVTAALAPDGQTIVFSSRRAGGKLRVFSTRAGGRGSPPVGIAGSLIASISVNGEMALIRDSDNTLVIAPLGGGEPRPLLPDVAWASWAPDGKSLAILRHPDREKTILEFPIGTPLCEAAG